MPTKALTDEAERARLLEAGHAVLTRQGYEGLRVDDVLREAELGTRAFYRHFEGKSALFLALFTDEVTRSTDRLRGVVDATATPTDRVRAWIGAVLDLGFDPRLAERARGFMAERARLEAEYPDEVADCLGDQRAPLVEAINAGVADGSFPAAEPAADALAIQHLCLGLLGDQLSGSGRLSRPEAIELAERFALLALVRP
ncbi:MAG TPA: TetR/AcrR family transcriptional regulator [Acidimicrobiales bacterium]|nr:TetR/AcrR family transcriptional regulator [Acidimicrobiales bacterium]